MYGVAFAERFFDDILKIESPKKQDEVMDSIALLATVPEMGSRRLPKSIVGEFGDSVRKLVVSPFLVVYEVDPDALQIRVLRLVHQRLAR